MKDYLPYIGLILLVLLLAAAFYGGYYYKGTLIKEVSSDTSHAPGIVLIPIADTHLADSLKGVIITKDSSSKVSRREKQIWKARYDSLAAAYDSSADSEAIPILVARIDTTIPRVEKIDSAHSITLFDTLHLAYALPPLNELQELTIRHAPTPAMIDTIIIHSIKIEQQSIFSHAPYLLVGIAAGIIISELTFLKR